MRKTSFDGRNTNSPLTVSPRDDSVPRNVNLGLDPRERESHAIVATREIESSARLPTRCAAPDVKSIALLVTFTRTPVRLPVDV